MVWNFALNLEKKNSSYIGHRDPTDDVFFFWWSRWPIHLRCSLMLAIFSFRQKVEVLHHDQWWDFVGFPPLPAQIKTCHCLKAVPWGHVMGFGGRPIRFSLWMQKVSGLFHLDFAQLWGITSSGWWVWASLLLQSPVKWIISVQQLSPKQFHCRKTFIQAPANRTQHTKNNLVPVF